MYFITIKNKCDWNDYNAFAITKNNANQIN